jgi:hypothetical protein
MCKVAEFKKANPRINIEANILGYDNNIINSLTPRLVNDFNGVPAANQTATFPFVFPLQIPAGGYANTDLPLNVKQTFVKELYVMNKLLLQQLNINMEIS